MSLIMEFCVQQFWACRFTVSLCLLLLVQRSEEKWGEERWGDERRVGWYFFGHLVSEFDRMIFWSSCGGVWIHQVLLYGDGDGADVRSYCRVRRWFGWRPNCCVSVCRRIYDCSGLPYQRTVSYLLITVFSDRQVVVCGMIVCIVWTRVFFEFMLYTMCRT